MVENSVNISYCVNTPISGTLNFIVRLLYFLFSCMGPVHIGIEVLGPAQAYRSVPVRIEYFRDCRPDISLGWNVPIGAGLGRLVLVYVPSEPAGWCLSLLDPLKGRKKCCM
jgi:hypothetical protein